MCLLLGGFTVIHVGTHAETSSVSCLTTSLILTIIPGFQVWNVVRLRDANFYLTHPFLDLVSGVQAGKLGMR